MRDGDDRDLQHDRGRPETLSAEGEPTGASGAAIECAFPRFADDLLWWIEAAREQRKREPPPY